MKLLKFLYPPKCVFCHRILLSHEDNYICSLCYHRMNEQAQALKKLHQTSTTSINLLDYNTSEVMPIFYLATYAQSRYAIKRWKFQGNRVYARRFAQLMVHHFDFSQFESPILVPIPISPNRLKERGFNHSYDLAIELSKLTHIPVCQCLKRIRNTKKQSTLASSIERQENIKNCMALIKDTLYSISFPIKSLLLVDDIYTTGSTMREAMRILAQEELLKDTNVTILVVCTNSVLSP